MPEQNDPTQDIRDLQKALFGDKDKGEMGMVQKVDAMYEVFSALMFIGKIATWIAIVLAGVGAAWTAFGGGIKRLFLLVFGSHAQ
jgi:hypothetical protein